MSAKSSRSWVSIGLAIAGVVALALGAAISWRADSPIPLTTAGVALILLALLRDQVEEVVFQGLQIRMRKAVEAAESRVQQLEQLLGDLSSEVADLKVSTASALRVAHVFFRAFTATTGPAVFLRLWITIAADVGDLTIEVTTPEGRTITIEQPLAWEGMSMGVGVNVPLHVPAEEVPVGEYLVNVRGARGNATRTSETFTGPSQVEPDYVGGEPVG